MHENGITQSMFDMLIPKQADKFLEKGCLNFLELIT